MSTSTFALTATQIDTLRTSLDMRTDRIQDLLAIFSRDVTCTEDQWMVRRYTAELEEVKSLIIMLTQD